MTFHQLNVAMQDGTFGKYQPTAVFLFREDWMELAGKHPEREKHIKLKHVSVPHFVVNGTPIMSSDVSLPGVVTIVNSDKTFDGRYNFSTRPA